MITLHIFIALPDGDVLSLVFHGGAVEISTEVKVEDEAWSRLGPRNLLERRPSPNDLRDVCIKYIWAKSLLPHDRSSGTLRQKCRES